MLKNSSTKLAEPGKIGDGVSDNGKKENYKKAELDDKDEFSDGKIDSNKIDNNDVVEKKNHQKMSKF